VMLPPKIVLIFHAIPMVFLMGARMIIPDVSISMMTVVSTPLGSAGISFHTDFMHPWVLRVQCNPNFEKFALSGIHDNDINQSLLPTTAFSFEESTLKTISMIYQPPTDLNESALEIFSVPDHERLDATPDALCTETLHNKTLSDKTLHNKTIYNETMYNKTLHNKTIYDKTLYIITEWFAQTKLMNDKTLYIITEYFSQADLMNYYMDKIIKYDGCVVFTFAFFAFVFIAKRINNVINENLDISFYNNFLTTNNFVLSVINLVLTKKYEDVTNEILDLSVDNIFLAEEILVLTDITKIVNVDMFIEIRKLNKKILELTKDMKDSTITHTSETAFLIAKADLMKKQMESVQQDLDEFKNQMRNSMGAAAMQ
jgi:hypothetical protein